MPFYFISIPVPGCLRLILFLSLLVTFRFHPSPRLSSSISSSLPVYFCLRSSLLLSSSNSFFILGHQLLYPFHLPFSPFLPFLAFSSSFVLPPFILVDPYLHDSLLCHTCLSHSHLLFLQPLLLICLFPSSFFFSSPLLLSPSLSLFTPCLFPFSLLLIIHHSSLIPPAGSLPAPSTHFACPQVTRCRNRLGQYVCRSNE